MFVNMKEYGLNMELIHYWHNSFLKYVYACANLGKSGKNSLTKYTLYKQQQQQQ
jgi:hypothetical protein